MGHDHLLKISRSFVKVPHQIISEPSSVVWGFQVRPDIYRSPINHSLEINLWISSLIHSFKKIRNVLSWFSILFWKYLSCLFSVLGQKWSRRSRWFLVTLKSFCSPSYSNFVTVNRISMQLFYTDKNLIEDWEEYMKWIYQLNFW